MNPDHDTNNNMSELLDHVKKAADILDKEIGPDDPPGLDEVLDFPDELAEEFPLIAAFHELLDAQKKIEKGAWVSVADQEPPKGEEVIFTALIDGEFTDMLIGAWEGEYTQGDGLVMVTEDEDDWLSCTHWQPTPEPPLIE